MKIDDLIGKRVLENYYMEKITTRIAKLALVLDILKRPILFLIRFMAKFQLN